MVLARCSAQRVRGNEVEGLGAAFGEVEFDDIERAGTGGEGETQIGLGRHAGSPWKEFPSDPACHSEVDI
jgi:hypothetical protein